MSLKGTPQNSRFYMRLKARHRQTNNKYVSSFFQPTRRRRCVSRKSMHGYHCRVMICLIIGSRQPGSKNVSAMRGDGNTCTRHPSSAISLTVRADSSPRRHIRNVKCLRAFTTKRSSANTPIHNSLSLLNPRNVTVAAWRQINRT